MQKRQAFAAQPQSVPEARRFVSDTLLGCGLDSWAVLVLTSELTTNAVVHANSAFEVRIVVDGKIVRVEVINDEPELLLIMKEPSYSGGRGLGLVKSLASDCGAESRRDSKVVWFEVDTGSAEEASTGA